MDKEYIMLRNEILHLDTVLNNTIGIFYTFIVTYIAFALTQEDTVFILLSYIVIIPSYLIVISKMQGLCKIGAYLCVYLEGGDFNWESRNIKYKDNAKNIFSYIISSHFPFMFVSMAVTILYMYRTKWTEPMILYEKFKLFFAFFLCIIVLILIFKNRNITTKNYIKYWIGIK